MKTPKNIKNKKFSKRFFFFAIKTNLFFLFLYFKSTFEKNYNFFYFFYFKLIFLVFSDHFDVLISKIIFKK